MARTVSTVLRYCGLFGVLLGFTTFIYVVVGTLGANGYHEGDVFFPFIFSSSIVFGGLVVVAIAEILSVLLRIENNLREKVNKTNPKGTTK